MNRQTVYFETTMFNYYVDKTKEDNGVTVAFFEAVKRGEYEAYTSNYVIDELSKAEEPKRSKMLNLIKDYGIKVLTPSDEAERMAKVYINNRVIPEKKDYDALHIALATVNNLDLILSYNFKHINKLKTKTLIPAINLTEGYKPITITQPKEIIDYEEDK
jgi:predicted nucleic acid-binding protein